MGGRGGSSHAGGGGIATVPLSLANHASYEQQWVTNRFAMFTEEQRRFISEQLSRVFGANDFGMKIPSQVLDNVIDEGFKNQFQTGTSRGLLDFTARTAASKQLFGADVQNMRAEDFEKYGLFVSRDITNDRRSVYGDATVRFKRDRVIDRITYTSTDSLYPAGGEEVIGGRISTSSLAGLWWSEDLSPSEVISRVREAAPLIGSPNSWTHKVTGEPFIEIQYHGSLTIKDVQSINFTRDRPSQALVDRLRAAGVAVYYLGERY